MSSLLEDLDGLFKRKIMDNVLEKVYTDPSKADSTFDHVLDDFIIFVKKVIIESAIKGYEKVEIPIVVLECATNKRLGNPQYLIETLADSEELEQYSMLLVTNVDTDHSISITWDKKDKEE
jgi:hypothetical protein